MTISLEAPPGKTRVVQIRMDCLTKPYLLVTDCNSQAEAFALTDAFNRARSDPRNSYHAFDSNSECIRGPGNVCHWKERLGDAIASSLPSYQSVAH